MKPFYLLLFAIVVLTSCGSRKGYLDRNDADRSLQDAVKKIKKNPDDEEARTAIPQLYKLIQQKHLDQIKAYAATTQLSKWDNMINEYQDLQRAYDLIMNSTAAYKLVTPESYSTNLLQCRDSAAGVYYQTGLSYLQQPGRENAKKAYNNFQRVKSYDADYKEVNEKMDDAYQKAMVNVMIMPVDERQVQQGIGILGRDISSEYFQQNLLSDLSGNERYAARFFNSKTMGGNQIDPDWIISFRARSLNVAPPVNAYSERKVSAPIKIGTDSSGAPIYNNVFATIFVTRSEMTSSADLEMTITDTDNNSIIIAKTYNQEYKWSQETATFNGDRRALSQSDLNMLTNAQLSAPNKEQVLVEIYKLMYPRVLTQVRSSVSW
jgi:hypothetical protein